MAETEITADPGVPQIVVRRDFDAPPELLLRAHVEPELLERWLGPRWLTTTVDHLDARHGGTWRYTQRDGRGDAHTFHGLYHGTPSPDGIVQTWEYEGQPGRVSLNTITFERLQSQTRLRQSTVFQSLEDRDGYLEAGAEAGVRESMERLDQMLAAISEEE